MDKGEQIREGLHAMAARFGPAATMIATVESVDEANQTCTLDDDDLLIYEVRLRALITGNENIIVVPEVGSYVLALRLENTEEWMVLACDQIEKIKIVVGNCSFEIKDGFLIQKQEDTLKDALVTFIEAVENIIVIEGRNPDRLKLETAKTKIQNILN